MKQLLMLVILALLLVAGCAEMTASISDDNDAIGVRAGGFLTENNEAGLSVKIQEDDSEIRELGLYALHHYPDMAVKFRNPLVVEFLPEEIEGTPYLGAKMDYDMDMHRCDTEPVAGVIFAETFYIEHSLDGDSMFGIRFRF